MDEATYEGVTMEEEVKWYVGNVYSFYLGKVLLFWSADVGMSASLEI